MWGTMRFCITLACASIVLWSHFRISWCGAGQVLSGWAAEGCAYLIRAGSGARHGMLKALGWPRSWGSLEHLLLLLLLLKGGLQGQGRAHGLLLLLLKACYGGPLLRWETTLHGREPTHLGWGPRLLPHLGQGPLLARAHWPLGHTVLSLRLLHERRWLLLLLQWWQLLWQLLLGLERGWPCLLNGHCCLDAHIMALCKCCWLSALWIGDWALELVKIYIPCEAGPGDIFAASSGVKWFEHSRTIYDDKNNMPPNPAVDTAEVPRVNADLLANKCRFAVSKSRETCPAFRGIFT